MSPATGLAAGAGGAPAAKTDLPPALSAFIARRQACYHWSGEEPYDAARGRQIEAAIAALGCDRLDADEKRLRRQFGATPAFRKALDDARETGE